MKENQEYKAKQKVRMQNYYINNREKYNEYQRDYQRTIYYPNKRQEELKNKFLSSTIFIKTYNEQLDNYNDLKKTKLKDYHTLIDSKLFFL